MNVDFNEYVSDYREQMRRSLSFAGTDHDFFLRAKANVLLETARKRFGDIRKRTVLDVGCGIGLMEPYLVDGFGAVTGVDVAEQAVDYARKQVCGAEFHAYDGRVLPFSDDSFDVVFACCVMHHIVPAQRPAFAAEMNRVLKPGGLAVAFEHNPINPATRLAVARCDFDRDAVLLYARTTVRLFRRAGLENVRRQYILVSPWEGRLWSAAEKILHWLPLGAQYCAVGTKTACLAASGLPTVRRAA
jgi:SAM-dependent methyltransferase